jgi:hypothetical protein
MGRKNGNKRSQTKSAIVVENTSDYIKNEHPFLYYFPGNGFPAIRLPFRPIALAEHKE